MRLASIAFLSAGHYEDVLLGPVAEAAFASYSARPSPEERDITPVRSRRSFARSRTPAVLDGPPYLLRFASFFPNNPCLSSRETK
jgi:hypothetical protein